MVRFPYLRDESAKNPFVFTCTEARKQKGNSFNYENRTEMLSLP